MTFSWNMVNRIDNSEGEIKMIYEKYFIVII